VGIIPRQLAAVPASTSNVAFRDLNRDPSWQDGDFVMAEVVWTNASALTPPAGWALDGAVNSNTTNLSSAVYVMRLTSADVGPWRWSIGTATRMSIGALALDGVDPTTPILARSQNHTGATYTGPALTVAGTTAPYIVSFWNVRTNTTANQTCVAPGTHTPLVATASAQPGTTVQLAQTIAVLTEQPNSVGTFGPFTASGPAPAASGNRQIALKPAPVIGGPPTITSIVREDVVEVTYTADAPPPGSVSATLTQTGGTTVKGITESTPGTFRVVLPDNFTDTLTFTLTVTANAQQATRAVSVGPGSGDLTYHDWKVLGPAGWQ
jgi:hypothetical protein